MSIQVTACLNPLSSERSEFTFDSGISVSDIIKKIDVLHAVNTGWRVLIDDEIITDFSRVPEDGQHVYIKLVPEGDNKEAGTGMKVAGGALVAVGVVVGVLTSWTGIGAFAGAALVGAGIGVMTGGVVLYNTDIPSLDANNKKRETPEQDPSIRGSRNQMRPYGTIPTLFGRRRIYTDLAAKSHTWVDPSDGSVYLYQLFCVGQRDMTIETDTVKIEETFLKDFSATGEMSSILNGSDRLIQMSVAYGRSTPPLMEKCVHEIQCNSILKKRTDDGIDGSLVKTTPDGTTEINVDIFFYNGLGKYNDKAELKATSVEVKAYYKKANEPDTSYKLLGYFSNGSNTISGNELKTKRYAITKSGLDAESYTVKLTRETEDNSDSKIIDDVYVGSIRAIKNEPPVRPEICSRLTLIGLKIKASEKLNNVVDQLNFIARTNSNPADAALYAMQGDMAQQKLPDREIDIDTFQKLRSWCHSHSYQCNAYVTEPMTISQLLSSIASTCRSEILRINGKITVIQDIERDTPMQLFSPRNSFGYNESIALADIPDELKIGFVDAGNGFAENELSVYNTPRGTPSGYEKTSQELSLWGITNSVQARKLGMYKYAVTKHRPMIHKFNADFEYLMCRKGDWIKYAGDIALAGITQGRITELSLDAGGRVTGFETDEEIPMENGRNYAVRVRKSSGEITLINLRNMGTASHSVTFEVAIAYSDSPKSGDLFAFGTRGNDSIDLIVTDIQCGENLSAELICVEYAPEIFGVDSPDFELPPFENKLSEVASIIDAGEVSGWKTWMTYHDSNDMPLKPTGRGTTDGWHYTQTAESKWVSTKTAKTVTDGEWSAPMPTGQLALARMLGGDTKITNPDNVTGLTATARKDSIEISWNPATNNGLKNAIKHYSVEISKDIGENWEKLADVYGSFASYTFKRDSDGYPEAYVFDTWRIRVRAENVYGLVSEAWAVASVNSTLYGTWKPAVSSFTLKEADEGGINLAWSAAKGINGKELYGSNRYRITVLYDGAERKTIETEARNTVYDFDRNTDKYPEKPTVADAEITLDKYTIVITVINESSNTAQSTPKYIDFDNYKTWIPRPLEGDYAVRSNASKRTATLLFPPQNAEVYGNIVFGVTVSRIETDTVTDTESGETIRKFYTPDIIKDSYTDINSYKDESVIPVFVSGSFKQNLPLLGQDMRSIQLDRYDVDFRDGESVKDADGSIEQYASSREYYVYDSEGIQSFRNIYEIHSGINIDEILSGLKNGTVSVEWVREGGSDTDYTKCYMTLTLLATPMPDDTYYIYRVFAKNIQGNAVSAAQNINILATPQSAADLVDKAITANKLDDQSVTTEKIAAGAITADEIAAVNLLAKGATAGNMTAEGLQVPNSGFWAGKAMRYDYTDPNNVERTYTAEAGEFFVGNNPNHEKTPTDDDEYLHFIPRTNQFFLAIKNIVFQSLATIVKGVFRIKNSLTDSDTDAFMTVNPTTTESGGTPAKTVNVNGNIAAKKVLLNAQNVIEVKDKSLNGFKMHDNQTDALYIEGREASTGDSGGLAITNDGVTVFGAGDTDGVLRVVNEDNVDAGAVFKVMKDGSVDAKNTISAPTFSGNLEGNAKSATTAQSLGQWRVDANQEQYSLFRAFRGIDTGDFIYPGYYGCMTNINADGSKKWWHLLSMDWIGQGYLNWFSQLLLPTQDKGIPKYRYNVANNHITYASWRDFITQDNFDEYLQSRKINNVANADKVAGRMPGGNAGDLPYIMDQNFGSNSGYFLLSNNLVIQWVKEYQTSYDDTWIYLPFNMESVNYVILDGRKGTNLADTTGWKAKEPNRFCVNTENPHIADFLIIGIRGL